MSSTVSLQKSTSSRVAFQSPKNVVSCGPRSWHPIRVTHADLHPSRNTLARAHGDVCISSPPPKRTPRPTTRLPPHIQHGSLHERPERFRPRPLRDEFAGFVGRGVEQGCARHERQQALFAARAAARGLSHPRGEPKNMMLF